MVLKSKRVIVTEVAQKLKLKYSFYKMEMKTITGCTVICHHTAAHAMSIH